MARMNTSPSAFFAKLGLPLRNIRWSWCARHGDRVLLRTWSHEYSRRDQAVVVLRPLDDYEQGGGDGLTDRIEHLRATWQGGISGYAILANPVDSNAHPRQIKDFRDDVVFPIERLTAGEQGTVFAVLGKPVPVELFDRHAQTHRTTAGEGDFPLDILEAELGQALEAAPASDLDAPSHDTAEAEVAGPSEAQEAASQRAAGGRGGDSNTTAQVPNASGGDLQERARRFAEVEVRPMQREFRQAVFEACGGCCVVTGCDIPEAVEAAHLKGRRWRDGHNAASDGVLLRRDIHALYDKGLIGISDTGQVTIADELSHHYSELQARHVVLPAPLFQG